MRYKSHYNSEGVFSGNRRKGFCIIYTLFLCKTFSYKPSFMSFHISFFISFGLEHLLTAYSFVFWIWFH
ncbi:hypothetical protein RchiOBHm_Chr1g0337461 [Rosa chinensis]|uniref:Uncharacterized protein n=1 Tax=Rosa chinensis TaxID=74649 RepID=A0A2P6SCX4_ROSCH|nr:hypothetical protein RchiOBHm_Chr1g0337461 [Rosa chinensis]